MARDEKWMREALALARKGEGLTRPNPPVGAVIVKDGEKVGEGYHASRGGPHAEVVALESAGDAAREATLYVTLEPCSTYGETPPCTKAIIEAGLKRVVIATVDPNFRHAGRGVDILCEAGIAVKTAVCLDEAERLLEPFAKWISTSRPWVTLKLGMSLDGYIADRRGVSKWITGPAAREEVQALRRSVDAIMVGAGTALADDPSLLPRPAEGRKPFRIVLDEEGVLAPDLKIFSDGRAGQTIVATTKASKQSWRNGIECLGAGVWVLPSRLGHVSLKWLLLKMGSLGILHILCEGGAKLAGDLVEQGLVDEYMLFVAPCLFGANAKPAIGGSGWLMKNRRRLRFLESRSCGDDIMIRARDL